VDDEGVIPRCEGGVPMMSPGCDAVFEQVRSAFIEGVAQLVFRRWVKSVTWS
jgi:hypothetical protein